MLEYLSIFCKRFGFIKALLYNFIWEVRKMADLENYQKVERTTLTTEETAKYLGVSYWLVGQMVRKNEIPHFRVGGRILFRKKSIDDYMEQQEKIAFDKLYASKK
jgi:DNA binding domain protein, excisionase family